MTGDKHTRLPWRITESPRKIVGADGPNGEPGGTVANLTALDMPKAELIVKAVKPVWNDIWIDAYQGRRNDLGDEVTAISYDEIRFPVERLNQEPEDAFQKEVREAIDKLVIGHLLEIASKLDREIHKPFFPHYLEAIGFEIQESPVYKYEQVLQPIQIVPSLIVIERVRWIEVPEFGVDLLREAQNLNAWNLKDQYQL